MNIEPLAQAITAVLIPAFPYLLKGLKVAGEKAAEKIGEKGGEALSEKTAKIWETIKAKAQKRTKIENAANILLEDPQDDDARNLLNRALQDQLKENPALAHELSDLLGGEQAVQEILASSQSKIQGLDLKIKGRGRQKIKASGKSRIENVKLHIEN
jgi:hypothetical protein